MTARVVVALICSTVGLLGLLMRLPGSTGVLGRYGGYGPFDVLFLVLGAVGYILVLTVRRRTQVSVPGNVALYAGMAAFFGYTIVMLLRTTGLVMIR